MKADKDLNAAYAGVIDPLVQQAKDGGAECLKPVEPIRMAERAWMSIEMRGCSLRRCGGWRFRRIAG